MDASKSKFVNKDKISKIRVRPLVRKYRWNMKDTLNKAREGIMEISRVTWTREIWSVMKKTLREIRDTIISRIISCKVANNALIRAMEPIIHRFKGIERIIIRIANYWRQREQVLRVLTKIEVLIVAITIILVNCNSILPIRRKDFSKCLSISQHQIIEIIFKRLN